METEYAKSVNLAEVTLATFLPAEDDAALEQFSVTENIDGVNVTVAAIGWGEKKIYSLSLSPFPDLINIVIRELSI